MIQPTRRDFLRYLLATPLAATMDYEKLLWRPSPIITVPAIRAVTLEEINAITYREILPGVVDNFFTSNPLTRYLRDHHTITFEGTRMTPVRGGPIAIPCVIR